MNPMHREGFSIPLSMSVPAARVSQSGSVSFQQELQTCK